MTTSYASMLPLFWQQLRKPLELEVTHGCPDRAIVGTGIGPYAQQWAARLPGGSEDDRQLARSIARGLRDYAAMPAPERRRRAMAAIDLLRQREQQAVPAASPARTPAPARPQPAPAKPAAAKPARARKTPEPSLPTGDELLAMSVTELAPRAQWPKLLAKLQIYTVRDLLYHVPRSWVEISRLADLPDGARAAVVATVTRREYEPLKSKQAPHPLYKYILTVEDETATAWVTAISMESERGRGKGKAAWTPAKLCFKPGDRVFVLAKVERVGKLLDLRMEDIYALADTEAAALTPGAPVPLYALTHGVYQNQVHRAVLRVLHALGRDAVLPDSLPEAIRTRFALLPLVEALRELHSPSTPLRHEHARKRLAFEEFLIPQLLMAQRRWATHHDAGLALRAAETMDDLVQRIAPFAPTLAQLRVLGEIEADLRGRHPMNRLLQGDVGSGKTLVAAAALAFAVRSGVQAAMMAPTEILAEQLHMVLTRLLAPLGIHPVLLTGTVNPAQRRETLTGLAAGHVPVAVGTHALIQEGVLFKALGLVIVDEQHRFGVLQRAALRGKGATPNTLVMTATPIPRTLSLSAFGDLDLSVLDELPPGRRPVETLWVSATEMREAYARIREQLAQGRQAYVVCPLVEESELLQVDAATETAEELRRAFPGVAVGLLHGRLRPEEKDAAMEAFRRGETAILACTTVIEVGVDVPNATVMLIRNAERFGLAQLHQLRGRVGRSEHPSHCLLVSHPRYDPGLHEGEDLPARARLRTMIDTQDGFVIAEADLAQRGPGEILGTRQSGLLDFNIGNVLRDGAYLEHARQAAQTLIADDHDLTRPEHADLRTRLTKLRARIESFRA